MDFIKQKQAAERVAWIITRCYSKFNLDQAAKELGVPVLPGVDIFSSAMLAGKAPDYSSAVSLVARYLDSDRYQDASVAIDAIKLVAENPYC